MPSAVDSRLVALLAEGVDRNFKAKPGMTKIGGSPSSRRAWIEIATFGSLDGLTVSPSSRRAWIEISRSGGVWRGPSVALLAEGVDRNPQDDVSPFHDGRSPSSRRAWIEIYMESKQGEAQEVALLAEGVDRNYQRYILGLWTVGRPPRGGRG